MSGSPTNDEILENWKIMEFFFLVMNCIFFVLSVTQLALELCGKDQEFEARFLSTGTPAIIYPPPTMRVIDDRSQHSDSLYIARPKPRSLKHFFRRLCVVSSAMMIVLSLDPFTARQRLPFPLVISLLYTVTSLIYTALGLTFYRFFQGLYLVMGLQVPMMVPPMLKLAMLITYGLALSLVIVISVFDKYWVNSVFLIWLALISIFCVVPTMFAVHRLWQYYNFVAQKSTSATPLKKNSLSGGQHLQRFTKSLVMAISVITLAIMAIILEIFYAEELLRDKSNNKRETFKENPVGVTAFLAVIELTIVVALWYVWVPILNDTCRKKQSYDGEASVIESSTDHVVGA